MTADDRARTGRTTRMLAEARRLRDSGRAVYVVFHSRAAWKRYDTAENNGIRFETLDSLRTLDLQTGRLAGAHPNCVVLIDHHVMWDRFAWAMREAFRFDLEVPRAD